jgi:hypothetical protein
MKRWCSGCAKRKKKYMPLSGGNWYCIDWSKAAGMTGSRLTNVAEKNSKEWRAKPCQHQSVRYAYTSVWFTNYQISICNRCNHEVTRIIVGYHNQGKR